MRGVSSSVQPSHISWPQVAAQTTDNCLAVVVTDSPTPCCRAKDPDKALGGSMDQDFTVALGGISSYSHQADPHYSGISSSVSLHCAHTILLLFLFHLSTTYLLILVVPRVSGCLGLSQECYAPPVPCGKRSLGWESSPSFFCLL